MNTVVRLLRGIDVSQRTALPDLHAPSRLLLTSDYGGQHASALGEVYAFVLIDPLDLGPWLAARAQLRDAHGLGRRRMAFKSLGDRTRQRVLPAFLAAADRLNGLLFLVRIHKRVGSLFVEGSDRADPRLVEALAHWPAKTVERLLRVCHFASLLLAGLSRSGQDVLWITDQDDIAANVNRHRSMTAVFGTVISHYLEHSLGHLRLATTASDTGDRAIEDLVALADLAAGAVGQVLDGYDGVEWPVPGLVRPPPCTSTKVARLTDWLSDARPRLKRFVLSIEPAQTSSRLQFRHVQFVGSHSLRAQA